MIHYWRFIVPKITKKCSCYNYYFFKFVLTNAYLHLIKNRKIINHFYLCLFEAKSDATIFPKTILWKHFDGKISNVIISNTFRSKKYFLNYIPFKIFRNFLFTNSTLYWNILEVYLVRMWSYFTRTCEIP